jgi:hypothetical protein
MGGGLINIVTYGANDLYLTGSPQITFFKVVYRRYTNFSTESVSISLGNINFDEEINVPFPKIGDLFNNTYLQLEIPEIHLLKTDTTADLTNSELTFLNSALPIPLTNEQIAIVNDYKTILAFLTLNCQAYRVAMANKNIQNQSVETYVTSILTAGQFIGNTETNYINALNRAIAYEKSIGNKSNDFILTYQTSDINYILNSNIVIPNAYSSYTIQQVTAFVTNAINISVRVKKYYFDKVKQYSNLQKESLSLYAKFAWVHKLGNAIIDRIDVNIGGERIDRHYSDWINIWHELTGHIEQNELYDKLMGNIKELTTFDRHEKPAYTLTIPLSFWFCRKAGLSFPIIALQYSTISLTIKLKKIDECAYVEKLPTVDNNGDQLNLIQLSLSDIWDNKGYVLNGNLLVDYVYLDSLERKRFAQSAHEYLIETSQRLTINNTSDNKQNINLDFLGPCKEMIWIAQKTAYLEGNQTQRKLPFVYSINPNGKNNPLISAQLLLNGYVRIDAFKKNYFNYLQPYVHHTKTPADGINLYSFALFPEEHQPSSACNFSRIANAVFMLTFNKSLFSYNSSDINPWIVPNSNEDQTESTTINLTIYASRYDVVRFIGGMGGFAYKYMI